MLTLKTVNFRPAHENKVDFHPRTENMSISILTLKPIQFLSLTQNKVNFDPNTKIKSISIPTLKTSQFSIPPYTKTE